MSEKTRTETESSKEQEKERTRPRLKIQDPLPIRAVGIENERERKNYSDLPPQNYIHNWWARRPTPATRLALLASVLPDSIDDDQLLRWMEINPSNKPDDLSVAEHVRQRRAEKEDWDGRVYDLYGYRKSYKRAPEGDDKERLHQVAKEAWGGELPTVMDSTAGGGSIPFESLRYGFPTIANELNPVASVILQAILEHPRLETNLASDIEDWGETINELARDSLENYFHSPNGQRVLESLWAHRITCPDCGFEVPLVGNWWLDKDTDPVRGVAVRPHVNEEVMEAEFEVVRVPQDVETSEFNPTDGTISHGKGTCLNCDYPIEGEEINEQLQSGNFEYELYAVRYESRNGRDFRVPTSEEVQAAKDAKEKVENDIDLSMFLDVEIEPGEKTDEPRRRGMTKWQDMFAYRQLLAHYEYWQAFEEVKPKIRSQYDDEEAEAILTFLSIAADKALDYNSRMSAWDASRPKIGHTFAGSDFAFSWGFAESHLVTEDHGYQWVLDSIVEVYEELRELAGEADTPLTLLQGDAANMDVETGSVDAVVFDPPYYGNVMYAELSDFFYVWLKKYLGDVYPDYFTRNLTDKDTEAVANPSRFEDVAGENTSKKELARKDYEKKMTGIFEEIYRCLGDDGIFTMMFTHKETEAWDTLTTSLINAGFTITSTHPVSTETPDRVQQQGRNSAESTILLVSEKRHKEPDDFTLWEDVRSETRTAAIDRVKELEARNAEFTKVDLILASFGPTLQVFTENYPVVNSKGDDVAPEEALDEARDAVIDYLIEQYLNEEVQEADQDTRWYLLSWFVFGAQKFPFDEANRLAMGTGTDMTHLKRNRRLWRKDQEDIILRMHDERVQNVNKKPDSRSSRKPVNPEAMTFDTHLDKVHAAFHIYDAKGASEAWNWLNTRDCASDPEFKATLEALIRVLPPDTDDWEIARDLTAGETGELLDLDLDAEIFENDEEGETQGRLTEFGN